MSLQTVPIAEVALEDRYDVTKVNGLTGKSFIFYHNNIEYRITNSETLIRSLQCDILCRIHGESKYQQQRNDRQDMYTRKETGSHEFE